MCKTQLNLTKNYINLKCLIATAESFSLFLSISSEQSGSDKKHSSRNKELIYLISVLLLNVKVTFTLKHGRCVMGY